MAAPRVLKRVKELKGSRLDSTVAAFGDSVSFPAAPEAKSRIDERRRGAQNDE